MNENQEGYTEDIKNEIGSLLGAQNSTNIKKKQQSVVYYSVNDTPPWFICILLGFQHFLTALGGTISLPLVLGPALCIDQDLIGMSWIISTYFMVGGVATCLQSTFGVR